MKKYEFTQSGYDFVVTAWSDNFFELHAFNEVHEHVWTYPNNIYRLADCSTHVRCFLDAKGLRVKWSELSTENTPSISED